MNDRMKVTSPELCGCPEDESLDLRPVEGRDADLELAA